MIKEKSFQTADEQLTILIVDDVSENLAVLGEILHLPYRVQVANSGRRELFPLAAGSDPA